MEPDTENVDSTLVKPMIDDKPVPNGELVGDALSVIALKDLADLSDPDRVVKRNSFRNLHRPDISHLNWVSETSSKQEVGYIVTLPRRQLRSDPAKFIVHSS